MGYSIAIRISDSVKRNQVESFLNRHYRPYSEVFGMADWESHVKAGPQSGPLGYDNSKKALGFDYSCFNDIEHHYVYALMAWLALKFGDRMKNNGKAFLVYDGSERWPVVVGKRLPGDISRDNHCDQYGWFDFHWQSNPTNWKKKLIGCSVFWLIYKIRPSRVKRMIHAEIQRLEQTWAMEKGFVVPNKEKSVIGVEKGR